MKKSIPFDAPYKAGFYAHKLHFHAVLLVNPRSQDIPTMDLLNTITPLKAAVQALFPAKRCREIVKAVDAVYESVDSLKKGSQGNSPLDEGCAIVIHLVTEAAEGSLAGRHRHLFDSGRQLSLWHNRLEPPFALDPNELMTLTMTIKASNIPDVPNMVSALNHEIETGIPDIHERIWAIHNQMLDRIRMEAARAVIEADGKPQDAVSHVTGLPNLATFERDAEKFFRSELLPFTLAFLDIDNFKKLNAVAGHDEADEVIMGLGKFLNTRLVGRARVYHRSGDEFYLVMENTTSAEAELLMNRLLTALNNHTFTVTSGTSYRISISIGMAAFPRQSRDMDTLRRYANDAENISKQRGKNCCTVYSEDEV